MDGAFSLRGRSAVEGRGSHDLSSYHQTRVLRESLQLLYLFFVRSTGALLEITRKKYPENAKKVRRAAPHVVSWLERAAQVTTLCRAC